MGVRGRGYGAWWAKGEDRVPWAESAVALSITGGVFAVAFIAMTTVRRARESVVRERVEPSRIVRLPTPVPERPPVDRQRPRQTPIREVAPTTPPAAVPNPVTPVPNPTAPRDTGAAAAAPTPTPAPSTLPTLPPLRQIAPFEQRNDRTAIGGMAPAGAAVRRQPLTAAQRDSFAVGALAPIPKEAMSRKPTADEIAAVRAQREPGLDPNGRAARLPGEKVYAPTMGGNVAVAVPMISIAVGKNRDRKRDAAIDADNQLRLRRLLDRAALRRDSIRADSLRRDSIARLSRRPD